VLANQLINELKKKGSINVLTKTQLHQDWSTWWHGLSSEY